jgi:hypothetical protein
MSSEVHFNWTAGPMSHWYAGTVHEWPGLAEWVRTLTARSAPELKRFVKAGKTESPGALEHDLVAAMEAAGLDLPAPARPGAEDLLYLLLARRPDVSAPHLYETEEPMTGPDGELGRAPFIIDRVHWVAGRFAALPREQQEREALLLEMHAVLRQTEEGEERDARLQACLGILALYPAPE